jgi:hypothetical protein
MKNNIKKIEKATEKYLKYKYPKGIIVKEFGNIESKTRPDYAVFLRDKIIYFELKGNSDNLARLDRQVFLYKKIADQLILILDKKYKNKQTTFYNKRNNVGLIFFDKKFKKNLDLRLSFAKEEPFNVTDIIYLLYGEELKILTEDLERDFGKLSTKESRIMAIKYIFTQLEIKEYAHEILFNRMKEWEKNGKPTFYGNGTLNKKIKLLDCKSRLYKEFLINFTFIKNRKHFLFE